VFKNVERIGRIKIAGNPTKSEPAALLGGDSKVLHGRRRQRKDEPEQQQKRHLPEREHSDGFQYGHGCVTFLTRARVCLGSSFSSAVRTVRSRHKKAPDDAGAFELLDFSRDQYFATTGPPQLKR
jgi:hypothetical protein